MALQKAASLKPEPSFWYNLGQNFRKAFHSAEEEQAYYAALQANPKFAPALAGLAYLALLKSDYDKATATAREALAADSQDAEAHYIIGVGRLNGGSFADAMNEAEAALKSHPRYAAALLLKYQAMLGQWVKGREERSAQDSLQYLKSLQTVLEDGVKLGDELEEAELWQEQLKLLNRMADRFTSADASAKSEQNAVSIKSLTQKPRLTYKEKAKYTEEARQAQVQGVVALQLLISAEGQVKDILVVRLLSHGLTIKAVEAAHSMKFEPGMKDGQRVAVLVNVEFSFNIY